MKEYIVTLRRMDFSRLDWFSEHLWADCFEVCGNGTLVFFCNDKVGERFVAAYSDGYWISVVEPAEVSQKVVSS